MLRKNDSHSLAEFKQIGRKGGRKSSQDPFWPSRFLFRPWTIYLSWALARVGVTGNGASLLSGIAIFASAILFGMPQPLAWLAGALCAQIYFVLDHVDGEIGRFEREALRRDKGMSGHFCDTACHSGEHALMATLGLRLFVDLDQPWWLVVVTAVAFFPGAVGSWQRYSECVLKHMERTVKNGVATIDAPYLRPTSWAVPQHSEAERTHLSLPQRVGSAVLQLVGFPGYFLTLLVCTILDVIPAVPSLTIVGQKLPYLLLWFFLRALHRAAADSKSLVVYYRRLSGLRSLSVRD